MDVMEKTSNEKRLIDANALREKLQAHHDFFVNAWGGFSNLPVKDKARVDEITNCIAEVVNATAVDAVEVVRCKDCKHYKPQNKSAHWENRTNYCNRIATIKVQPYDFCSYGERKEGASNEP